MRIRTMLDHLALLFNPLTSQSTIVMLLFQTVFEFSNDFRNSLQVEVYLLDPVQSTPKRLLL